MCLIEHCNVLQTFTYTNDVAQCRKILTDNEIPRGLTARIAGFHPAGPGSTPGVGNRHFLFCSLSLNQLKFQIRNSCDEMSYTYLVK